MEQKVCELAAVRGPQISSPNPSSQDLAIELYDDARERQHIEDQADVYAIIKVCAARPPSVLPKPHCRRSGLAHSSRAAAYVGQTTEHLEKNYTRDAVKEKEVSSVVT